MKGMNKTVVRIALVNIVFAVLFAALVKSEIGSVPIVASALVALALVLNGLLMLRCRRGSAESPNHHSGNPGGPAQRGPDQTGTPPLGRPVVATSEQLQPPKPANVREGSALKAGEMPPWLRVKGNIVMTWEGKHHVAPINDDDPFEVAQRLYERLRRRGAEGRDSAGPAAAASK